MAQSQYADINQFKALACTPASYQRFFDALGESAIIASLQAASSEVDVYLTEQYDLPLIDWDQNLSKITAYITYYNLFVSLGYNPAAPGDRNVHERYEKSLEWLLKISKKELHPNYVDSSSGVPAAGPMAVSSPPLGFASVGLNCWNNNGWGSGNW